MKVSVKDIAHLRGLSGPLLFALDTKSAPGKTICHFVRLETIVFDNDSEAVDATQFKLLHPDNDLRIALLAQVVSA